ncbi:MAG: SGNH/GDSL hydrolase family protein [Bacteroidota bacterium]
MTSRRTFIRQTGLALGTGLTLAACADTATADPQQKEAEMQTESPTFLDGQTVLFQGDSITDGGRRRNNGGANSPQALGSTYPVLVASELLGQHIDKEVKFYNRGISGNKVFQLAERWQEDCLDLQPDILTILIGVNDFWHMVNGDYDGTVEIYERDFMALIEQTKAALPNVKIIIAEPFAVKGGSAMTERWDNEFPAYQAAAKRVAEAHKTGWIACQSLFDEALTRGSVQHWCPDGVHPSPAGHQLMTEAWIQALREA